MEVTNGDICWVAEPNQKARPCVVLTRDESIEHLRNVLVAPVTTRIRGLPTEVLLGRSEGLRQPCAANMQGVLTVPKSMLRDRLGTVAVHRWHEVCDAMAIVIGC